MPLNRLAVTTALAVATFALSSQVAAQPFRSPAVDAEARRSLEQIKREVKEEGFCYSSCIERLESLLLRLPGDAEVFSLLRGAYYKTRDWDGLVQLVESYPADDELRSRQLGIVYYLAGRYKEARAEFASLWSKDPENAALALELGLVLFHSGELDLAEPKLLLAFRSLEGSQKVEAGTLLGLTALYRGDIADARELMDKVLAVNPNYLPAVNAMARIESASGDSKSAAAWVEKATAMLAASASADRVATRVQSRTRMAEQACAKEQWQECARIITETLPDVVGERRVSLYRSLSEVYRAAGDDEQADLALARAAALAKALGVE